jgi:hypothetical protein
VQLAVVELNDDKAQVVKALDDPSSSRVTLPTGTIGVEVEVSLT